MATKVRTQFKIQLLLSVKSLSGNDFVVIANGASGITTSVKQPEPTAYAPNKVINYMLVR